MIPYKKMVFCLLFFQIMALSFYCFSTVTQLPQSAAFLQQYHSHGQVQRRPPPSPPAEYILALQWGYTVCGGYPICSQMYLVPDFTVHWLWLEPQPNPAGCKGQAFDDRLLVSLVNDLNLYWMNAENGDNIGFWRHEYNAHGICDNGTWLISSEKFLIST
ncbi:ribonuclease DdI-like [Papaver somniferum]|nr:ribonuclease DdI-like [Papaver somniferum]